MQGRRWEEGAEEPKKITQGNSLYKSLEMTREHGIARKKKQKTKNFDGQTRMYEGRKYNGED